MTACTKTGKVRHRTRIDATKALLAADRGRVKSEQRRENRIYYCAGCKGWHLTSKG